MSAIVIQKQIDAVIFDMDGLMIDSERIYSEVTNVILKPYGKEMTWEIKAGLMGRPGPDAAAFLIAATSLPLTPAELITKMEVLLEDRFRNVQILPGILKLVLHLKKHGIPIAIATGSKASNYKIKTAHLDHLFFPFGPYVICGDDPILLGKGKPDPTIFLEAAKLLSLTTPLELSRCLVFEDGAPGVRAGLSAGMQVCWVPEPELLEIMNEMKDPTFLPSLTLSSVEHFMPHEWGLPHYDAIVAVESRM